MSTEITKFIKNFIKFFGVFLVGLLLGQIFSPLTAPLVEKHIWHKEPDVRVTLNNIYRPPNDIFINFSDLSPTEYQYFMQFRGGDELTLDIDRSRGINKLSYNNEVIIPFGFEYQQNFVDKNGTIRQYNCIFVFPFQNMSAKVEYIGEAYIPSEPPDCFNCYEKTLSANNSGNRILTNFKSTVCVDGFVSGVEGKTVQKDDNCVEIRSEDFLPGDKITGRFYGEHGWGVERFSAWSDYYGEYPPDKLFQTLVFILPNCTFS